MAEELTNGEIARAIKRLDEELEQRASKEALAEFKGETREKFKRAEALAIERRDALVEKDKALDRRIDGLETKIDGIEKGRTAKAANWIAIGVLALTALGLLVTVLSHGGK